MEFQNRLEYHSANGRVNSSNDLATLGKNLVNFGPVTLEIHRAGIPKRLENYIANECIISGNDHCTSGGNSASFRPATPFYKA